MEAWRMLREVLINLPEGMQPPLPGEKQHHALIRGNGEPLAHLTIIRPAYGPTLEFRVEHHNPQEDPLLHDFHIAEFYPYEDPTTPFENPFASWEPGMIPLNPNGSRKDSTQPSAVEFTKMASNKKPSPIIAFYDYDVQGGDVRGRKLYQILEWDNDQLEKSHDYIQWLFPLPEGSVFNYNAPIVTEEVVEAFRNSLMLSEQVLVAFDRMMNFYGYEIQGNTVLPGPNWDTCSRRWCRPFDHNHLRITRILRSLRVLGLPEASNFFWEALQKTYNDPAVTISSTSMKFWKRAVKQPLHIAPDGERVDWLKKYDPDAKETKVDTKE